MSADNYAVCPRCQRLHNERTTAAQDKADAAYGKVSVAEFDRLRAAAVKLANAEPVRSMREDYDVGITDGTFGVDYRASCIACDFRFAFNHNVEVPAVDAQQPPTGVSVS